MKIIYILLSWLLIINLINANEIKKETYPISQCNKKTYTQEDLKDYEALIKLGESQGYNCLGLYYMREKNYDKAKVYFNKGKETGNIESYAQLGSLYSNFLKDKDEAIKYYTYAANKGHAKAAHNLGVIYDKKFEYKKALKWYEKSFEKGDVYSLLAMGHIYRKERKYDKAIETFEEVGKLGNSKGYDNLALFYMIEKGHQDFKKSEKYFFKAIDMGNIDSVWGLGTLYEDKLKDFPNAIKWYKKGFELGSKEAVTRLGLIYEEKLKDYPNAIKWYKKGIDILQCRNCAYNLALIYDDVKNNYKDAITYYTKAYTLGDDKSANNIAYIYNYKYKDKNTAIEWYKKAAKLGNKKSINKLKKLGISYE